MKPQDDLLKEILAGEEISAFREASLQTTLVAIRSQRRRRRAFAASAVIVLIFAAAILFRGESRPITREIASSNPVPTPGVAAPAVTSGVRIISDEELFALFPGRSMALVGKPGQQHLVFMDKQAARSSLN
jgi:hypothetical protein